MAATEPTGEAVERGDESLLDVVLADGRALRARAGHRAGQALATWLAQHTSYLNLTDVQEGERRWKHMAVNTRQIVVAGLRGPRTTQGQQTTGRLVEIRLLTGASLLGRLPILDQQRLGDYIRSRGAFLEIADAKVQPRRDAKSTVNYADLAIGSSWIVSVVEMSAQAPDQPE